MVVYHIDRYKTLKEGQIIDFLRPPIEPEILKQFALKRYPKGLSHHGDFYFGRTIQRDFVSDSILESILEYERLLYYPDRPSRYLSIFAVISIDQLKLWMQSETFKDRDFNICELEVSHDDYALLDSAWYGFNIETPSFLVSSYKARRYWSGDITESPKYELLIKLPALVRKITPKALFELD